MVIWEVTTSAGGSETDFINVQPSGGGYTGGFSFYDTDTNSSYFNQIFRILANGHVGIGTASPAYMLDISGENTSSTYTNPSSGKYFSRDASITSLASTTTFNCSIHATGSIWIDSSSGSSNDCSFVSGNSDRRIKKDIEEIDGNDALEKMRKIKPVTYRYIDSMNIEGHKCIGFIAQDVENIIPQAVANGNTKFIPNIFRHADIYLIAPYQWGVRLDNSIDFNEFKNGEMKIVLNDDKETSIEGKYYFTNSREFIFIPNDALALNVKRVFVYGTKVNNFYTLANEPIMITAISAIKTLDAKNQELENEIFNLTSRMNKIESMLEIGY